MVKTLFYAIRHGPTAWNEAGRFQGHADVPLSPAGRAEVLATGRRLAGLFAERADLSPPAEIRASPLARAAETARILGGALGMGGQALFLDPRLAEAAFGSWEGLTTDEVRARFPDERRRRKAERWSFAPPGGQSHADLDRAMRPLLAALDGRAPVLLVTHSGNLRVLMAVAGGLPRAAALAAPVAHDRLFRFCGGALSVL